MLTSYGDCVLFHRGELQGGSCCGTVGGTLALYDATNKQINKLFWAAAALFPHLNCKMHAILFTVLVSLDRLCGLVVRVLGYRSGGPGSIPGTTRKKK
jgi:hypothetical protein